MSFLTHFTCSRCDKHHDPDCKQTVCVLCGKPLLARYDIDAVRGIGREAAIADTPSMWRYSCLLPVREASHVVSLGEGWTPLFEAPRLGRALGIDRLFVKDESVNPTGSFKARGLSSAVSRCVELGVKGVVIPSAGNAAVAAAVYAARAGLKAAVFLPSDTPEPFVQACCDAAAEVTLVDGLLPDCGRKAAKAAEDRGWFDLATLKEPSRLEGKKTLGFELAEQSGWRLPHVIVYPTGGGTGLVGMWKAFAEMEALGWVSGPRPRMVAVQSSGCAPIPRAFDQGRTYAEPWSDARTVASGLRVPSAIGDFLILEAVQRSHGKALAVEEIALPDAASRFSELAGVSASYESGAALLGLEALVCQQGVRQDETVVLFNTGGDLTSLRPAQGGRSPTTGSSPTPGLRPGRRSSRRPCSCGPTTSPRPVRPQG